MVFFFLIPSIPATLGNFLVPMMIGAKDLAFPRINLLSWYIYLLGGIVTIYALARRRRRYRLDFLRALQHHVFQLVRGCRRPRNFHQRLLVDSDGPEFHRHDSHDARAGHDLVPAAALYLVPLRHVADHDSGNAGDRDHDSAAGF